MKKAIMKAVSGLWKVFPIIIGTLLLVSLLPSLIPKSFYSKVFAKNLIIDPVIGTTIGSLSAGNPITSYIIGGEMLGQGVTLVAVTAFLVAWVTVGLIQLPAESAILGKKFALLRNAISFVMAVLVAIATILILKII